MIDSQSAVQDAVFAALNATAAVIALADVWQNPPEDSQPEPKGLVVIGLVSLVGGEQKDAGLDEVTIDVITYVRKPDARELYALNSAVRNALEGQSMTATGAEISAPVFVSADPDLMEDGETYWDRLRFRMFVQSA